MISTLSRWKKQLVIMMWMPFLAISALQAQEVGVKEVLESSVAVSVIVNIDQETRAITLKNDEAEEFTFVAGPEVENFAQLKRGDLVIAEYYSGLAVALEPKGSGLEARATELSIAKAKKGEKPGMVASASVYAAATIIAVDPQKGLVALEGPENTLVLKVDETIDLDTVEAGQEVEALYEAALVISVQPAPEVSGTVKMDIKAVALGVGVEWGSGTLTMYDGTTHELKIKGLSVLDVGISSIEATGEVYNLVEAKDIEPRFVAGQAGASLFAGGSGIAMKNGSGVVMKLKSTQKGVRLTLAGQGFKVTLK